MRVEVDVPAEVVEAIAERAAELVLERLPAPATSEFMTIAEAAELARCKPQRIYDLRSSGVLTKYGDGSRALVSRAELVAHLAGGVAPPWPQVSRHRMGAGSPRRAADMQSAAQRADEPTPDSRTVRS